MALVVKTGAVTALEIEEADCREVGASAVDAQVAISALAVLDAPTFSIGAGAFVGNTDTAVVTHQTWAIYRTVVIICTRSSIDAEAGRAAVGDIAIPVVTVFVGLANSWAYRLGHADSACVAGVPVTTFVVRYASNRAAPVAVGAVDSLRLEPDGTPRQDHYHPKS